MSLQQHIQSKMLSGSQSQDQIEPQQNYQGAYYTHQIGAGQNKQQKPPSHQYSKGKVSQMQNLDQYNQGTAVLQFNQAQGQAFNSHRANVEHTPGVTMESRGAASLSQDRSNGAKRISGGQFRNSGKATKKPQQLLAGSIEATNNVNTQVVQTHRAGPYSVQSTVKNSQISKSTGPSGRVGQFYGQVQASQSGQKPQAPRQLALANPRQMNSGNRTGPIGNNKPATQHMLTGGSAGQQHGSQHSLDPPGQQQYATNEVDTAQQDQRFRRRLVALAQAQQQRMNPQIMINTESRSLEERRELTHHVQQNNFQRQNAANHTGKESAQFHQVVTAREGQSKPMEQLIMVKEKNEGLLNSVRDVPHQQKMYEREQAEMSPAKPRNDSQILNSAGGGQSAAKYVMTASSNDGSAVRPIANQQKLQTQNQLSNSLQVDGSRRMAPRNKVNHLSGSAENSNRYIQTQKQGVNSNGQLGDQGMQRRRQPNLNNIGGDLSTHKNENTFSAEAFQPTGTNGKMMQNNTTGSQNLKQEIKEINKGLREGQKSQTILISSNNQNQKSLSQIQNRLSTDNKSAGARKPSRGHQKHAQNPTSQDVKHGNYLTNGNKLVFSTPALNTDGSQTSLPASNVIFHPHPLNNNVQGGNAKSLEGNHGRGNGGYMGTQNNKINFNATTTIGGQQQTLALDSARPQSQKNAIPLQQNPQTTVNNRNSRKNLRPIGKKGSQHGGSQNNLKKAKNPSRDQYLSTNDQATHLYPKQKAPGNQNQANQNLKGFQSLITSNASINFQQIQNEMSASTSRERALAMGGLNFAQTQTGQFLVSSGQTSKMISKDLVYQTNAPSLQQPLAGGQMANITNKNVLFKFKKNGSQNKNGQQQVSISQSNFQSLNELQGTGGGAGQPPTIPPSVGQLLKNQGRRGNFVAQKQGANPTGANSLQNTQPLQFDMIHGQNQLSQGKNLISQRSHGQQIQMGGMQIVNKTQKIQIPTGIGSSIQNSESKQGQMPNTVGTSKLRQRSTQEENNERMSTIQQDQLNQLSEIGIVEQHSKEESMAHNPLLMYEPSHHTPAYGNFEGMLANNINEISSFNEMAGAVGLSSLSGIEQIVAEGSQLSRIDSSDAHIFLQDRNVKANEGQIHHQLNTDSSDGFGEILHNDQGANIQAKTITQSARQSSINANPIKNQHFMSTTEGGLQKLSSNQISGNQVQSNESSKHTTVLGSLTSNFQAQLQQRQIQNNNQGTTQKILQGQSNSQQQIPTIQQANAMMLQHPLNTNHVGSDSARGVSSSVTNGQTAGKFTHQGNGQGAAATSTINSNKLIKINKSKKMVDTARRSRIRQLDGHNSQTHTQDTQLNQEVLKEDGVVAIENIKLVAIQSNGPPSRLNQKMNNQGMPVSATNSSSKNKQLFSGSQPALNFNNTQQVANSLQSGQSKKFGALLNSHRQEKSNGSQGRHIVLKTSNNDFIDNNYMSNTKNVTGAHLQASSGNKLQLTMNINTSAGQFNTAAAADQLQGVKQANTQKSNAAKFNILSVKKHGSTNNSSSKPSKNEVSNGNASQLPQIAGQNNQQQKPMKSTAESSKQQAQYKQQQNGENTSGQSQVQDLGSNDKVKVANNAANAQRQMAQASQGGDAYQLKGTKSAREVSDARQLLQKGRGDANDQLIPGEGQQTINQDQIQQQSALNQVPNNAASRSQALGQKSQQHMNTGKGSLPQSMKVGSVKAQLLEDEETNGEASNLVTSAVKIENQLLHSEQNNNGQPHQHQQSGKKKKSQEQAAKANTDLESNVEVGGQPLLLPGQNEVEENVLGSQKKEDSLATKDFIHVQNQQSSDQKQNVEQHKETQGAQAVEQQAQQDYNQQPTQRPTMRTMNKVTEQRTTMDTNSNRKQTTDSQQRTNFNTSMQNIPRGLINTAFSLSSVTSKDEVIPPLPTTPQNILRYYIQELTDYEKGEILDYETIYFLGNNRAKKVDQKKEQKEQPKVASSGDPKGKQNEAGKGSSCSNNQAENEKKEQEEQNKYVHNYGYDDEKGDYKIVVGDHIGYRYEIVEFLGKGSFGTALGCIDHKEKKEVAVKIVKNKKKYYYQASVELKILQYLRQHDHEDIMNVIHIEDYVVFRKHLCMSFERLSMNLFEFLKINDFNGFDHNLIRRFAIQLLYALKYLKQLEIIHCDLKPENILLKEENKSGIKIIDFGSSTFIDEKVYTYIQSRFYRAPEIMLGIPYTTAIDMWSLGCIMAELYIGYPLFPGESENDQMSRIMEMRDVPPQEVLAISERKQKFFKENNHQLEPIMLKNSKGKLRKANGKPLDYVIGDEDPDFNDFVIKCLNWNPETRLTPDEALKHVWVLKGLPPQVLIHHQKMHNIATPELPKSVKVARDEFLIEQQKEQELIMQAQQRKSRAQRLGNKEMEQTRDISYNPNAGRPQIQLKTPRQNTMKTITNNLNSNQKLLQKQLGNSQERPPNKHNIVGIGTVGNNILPTVQPMMKTLHQGPSSGSQFNIMKQNTNQGNVVQQSQYNTMNTQRLPKDDLTRDPQTSSGGGNQSGSTRRKFVIKKINK